MNQTKTTIIKSFLVAATLLGFSSITRAQNSVPASGAMGLLGQTYAGLTYSYLDLKDSSTNADNFTFEYNQALHSGLDGILTYDWSQSGLVAGDRANAQALGMALRAYSTTYSFAKPYAEVGAGYTWTKFAGVHDNSFVWEAAVGAEFQVGAKTTVTPFVRYSDAPDLRVSAGAWDFGVKANYWVNSQWSVTGGVSIDDDSNAAYTVGTNFRF